MSAVCESCEPGNYGDHDVTGFGVLISFGVSIFIMLGTVVIGYIGGFLREDRYNAIDTMILHTFHGAFRGSKGIPKANENRSIEEIQDLEGFVLTMSDQQLITGFSLILATNLIRYGVADLDKTISGYSYCIAMSLALLSCVTHLSAMTVSRGHYDSNKRLRDTRTFLMVAAIALLIPQFVTCQRVGTSLTLRCALDELAGDTGLHGDDDDIYVRTFLFTTLAMIGIIVCGYLRRILELYSPRFRESPEAWVAEACASIFSWPSRADINTFNDAAHADQLAQERLLLVGLNGQREYFVLVSIIAGELRGSFFGEIVWFLFYSTFVLCRSIRC